MIDTDDARDYADERAVRAEAAAERAEEERHEQVRADLANALGFLADEQQQQARRLLDGTIATINARGHLGPSHLLYLQRAAEVAHLAGRASLTVERHAGCNLGAQVEALLLAHARAASLRTAPGADNSYEVAVWATREVRKIAARVLAGTREHAGLAA